MDKKTAQARLDRIRDTPARNWRERRQKARVIAAAYRRGALLTKRRELMEAWANYSTHADELADRL